MGVDLYSIILLIMMTIIIIMLAYLATRFIGKKTSGYFEGKGIKILDRTILMPRLNLYVIQVGGRVYILATNNKAIQLLDSIDYEEWIQHVKNHKKPSKRGLLDILYEKYIPNKAGNNNPKINKNSDSNHKKGD